MQISTWFVLPLLMIQFGLFCTPILPLWAAVVFTTIFMLSAVAAALFGYISTALDPMDPRLSHDDDYKDPMEGALWQKVFNVPARTVHTPHPNHVPGVVVQQGEEEAPNGEDTTPKEKYCWVCEDEVHQESMHCRYCNKCVSKFDHHCQWLNTCVGERNYGFFYKTLWSILCMLTVHVGILLGTSIDILASGATKQRADNWFNANLSELVVAFNIFFFVFDMVALALIVQLLAFHMKLRRMGLTTYQYILKDNAEKRESSKIKVARSSKRIVAMGQARRDKKPILRVRLAMGKYLERIHPCLDPLPPDSPTPPDDEEENNEESQHESNNHENDAAEETKDEEVPQTNGSQDSHEGIVQ